MARDAELDRLKAAQDAAFARQQSTYQAQQRAWEQRSAARDQMNYAYEAKDRAYKAQQASWEHYQSVRASNGPRIDYISEQQQRAYQNQCAAYDQASAAHDRRDGAAARSYADQGKIYKAESQRCVAERRQLIEEIKLARARHEPLKVAFQQAKAEFATARARFDDAKARHERAQAEFQQAKADNKRAQEAFQSRLAQVRAERKSEGNDLAARAGVPLQYRDNVKISRDPDGTVSIYFGGIGEPAGPGHGHYVMDARGTVTYRRDPFDPHGAHNFTSNQADYFDAVRTESVSGSGEYSFRCMYNGRPALVETGYDTKTGKQKVDIYYGGQGDDPLGAGHGHAVAYRDDPDTIVYDRSPR